MHPDPEATSQMNGVSLTPCRSVTLRHVFTVVMGAPGELDRDGVRRLGAGPRQRRTLDAMCGAPFGVFLFL